MIHSITESTAKVKDRMDAVSLGSEEEAKGIHGISAAVAQMAVATEGTAAHAQETASASQELSSQANTLSKMAGQLRMTVGA